MRPKKKYQAGGYGQGKGNYRLDGSWSPGYLGKDGTWVNTGDIIPKPVAPSATPPQTPISIPSLLNPNTPAASNPTLGNTPWLAEGEENPLETKTNNVKPPLAPPTRFPVYVAKNTYEDGTSESIDPSNVNPQNQDMSKVGPPAGTPKVFKNESVTDTTTKSPYNVNKDIFFGLRGAGMLTSWLAQRKANNRMKEYDYKQQTALGQMNPMPVSQFQWGPNDYTTPNNMYAQEGGMVNPYSQYAKFGGNLRRMVKEYNKMMIPNPKYSNDDSAAMDMGDGKINDQGKMQRGGNFSMDNRYAREIMMRLMRMGMGPHPYRNRRMQIGGELNQENMKLRRGGNPARQQQGQQEQIMQVIQAYAQMSGVDPQEIMQKLQQMPEQEQQQAIQQMVQAVQQGQQQGQQGQQGQQEMPESQPQFMRGGRYRKNRMRY